MFLVCVERFLLFIKGFVSIDLLLRRNTQATVARNGIVGAIKVQSSVGIVVLVNGGPPRIVAIMKGSSGLFKFVGKYLSCMKQIMRALERLSNSLKRKRTN